MTMTADTTFASNFDDAPIFNPFQVIAMDGLITVGLIATLKMGGMGWGLSLLAGWMGGAVLTAALTFGVAYLCLRPTSRADAQYDRFEEEEGSPLVTQELSNTMQVWDADLTLEREYWARIAKGRKVARKSRRASTQIAFKMWDDDQKDDRRTSTVMPRRAVRIDRRQVNMEMPEGSERRRGGSR